MDEEVQAAEEKQGGDSAKNVQVLAIVLICILAVFMVTSLNRMKVALIKLNRQVDTLINTTAQNSMGTYQAVDADGNVLSRYVPVPAEDITIEADLKMDANTP